MKKLIILPFLFMSSVSIAQMEYRTDSFGNTYGSDGSRMRTDSFGNTYITDANGNTTTCRTDSFGNTRCN